MSRKEADGNGIRWTGHDRIQCGRKESEAASGKLVAPCSLYTTIHKVWHDSIA